MAEPSAAAEAAPAGMPIHPPTVADPDEAKLTHVPRPVTGNEADALFGELMTEIGERFAEHKDAFVQRCGAYGQCQPVDDAALQAAADEFHVFLQQSFGRDFVVRRVPQLTQLLPTNDPDLCLRKAQALLRAADLIITLPGEASAGENVVSFFKSVADAFLGSGAATPPRPARVPSTAVTPAADGGEGEAGSSGDAAAPAAMPTLSDARAEYDRREKERKEKLARQDRAEAERHAALSRHPAAPNRGNQRAAG